MSKQQPTLQPGTTIPIKREIRNEVRRLDKLIDEAKIVKKEGDRLRRERSAAIDAYVCEAFPILQGCLFCLDTDTTPFAFEVMGYIEPDTVPPPSEGDALPRLPKGSRIPLPEGGPIFSEYFRRRNEFGNAIVLRGVGEQLIQEREKELEELLRSEHPEAGELSFVADTGKMTLTICDDGKPLTCTRNPDLYWETASDKGEQLEQLALTQNKVTSY